MTQIDIEMKKEGRAIFYLHYCFLLLRRSVLFESDSKYQMRN